MICNPVLTIAGTCVPMTREWTRHHLTFPNSRMALIARITLGAVCLAVGVQSTASASFVVGGFDSSRGGRANVADGIYIDDARAALLNNFDVSAIVSTPTLTPEFLAGVDVLILAAARTDSIPIEPLSADEQTALLDYVKAGGSALLVGDGLSNFVPASKTLMEPFGVSVIDDGLTGLLIASATVPSHPVMNGPFGEVSQFLAYGSAEFNDLGPYATSLAKLDANNVSDLAVIESHALSPTSGRVLMFADANLFIDEDDSGFFFVEAHQDLFLNSINYLATPEPSSRSLAILGTLIGAVVGCGRLLTQRRIAKQAESFTSIN